MSEIYSNLSFPKAPKNRPYAFVDMVSTIDGKILSGDREDHVVDLGSKFDHTLMKRIAAQADAVLMGATTLRTTLASWDPGTKIRVVVTKSGDLPMQSGFFKSGEAFIATSEDAELQPPEGVKILRAGRGSADLKNILKQLKDKGVERLLVLGGSELNAQLLKQDLIDELFLTLAPKVKLGRDVPTYADGEPLSREALQHYDLVESHVVESEVFLRYRRLHQTES